MAIPRAKYQRLLYESAVRLGVDVRLSSRIKSIDESTPSVTLQNGDTIGGDVVIGADGMSFLSARMYAKLTRDRYQIYCAESNSWDSRCATYTGKHCISV